MKKRVISILLTCAMAACMLAGCGETKESSESSQKSEVKKTEGEKKAETDEKELTTIHILCNNDYNEEIKTEDWEQYEASKVLIADLEEIGIKLELECVPQGELANIVQTRLASGVDVPDIIPEGLDQNAILEYGEAGLILPVNELVYKYDEDGSIRAFYEKYIPGKWQAMTAPDGNLYWFSYISGKTAKAKYDTLRNEEYVKIGGHAPQIRKDWVEAVGEEVKDVYTPDELFTLLKKMYDEDANGNGVSDEIVYLPISSFWELSIDFGLSPYPLAGHYAGAEEVLP